ncbi:midasin-like isoform X3 [Anopheles darlingi]|uniref:midasin-like isoform X3 n=1 Tax=Anopheles darlingi TaxID=43151 RepID=UPI002100438C|nr:midasin-like isoform X3 [Anopheles darlingi]
MSGGDTQPKKRKDKKRKKDDEDTVKETTVHAPKQAPSAGAAQAAKEPGDIQMHIHSDHGTGGNWCAKVVFFILLAGLGALVGLIIMENKGLSNDDTPLSESRYSEFFNGWVDETRQDDHHHHEEILDAINSIGDHDDHDDDEEAHAVDDHDDDEHDGDENGNDQDDDNAGAPYPEEDDNDDDDAAQDDEDEGPAQKLDDDEVEEIYAQQEAAQQEAIAEDNDDDGDDDGDDDVEDDDDGADAKSIVDNDDNDDDDDDVVDAKQSKVEEDDEDDDNDDDKNDAEQDDDDDDKTRTTADNKNEGVEVDDDEDDDDGNEENDDDEDNEPNTVEAENSFDDEKDDDDEEDDEDKIVTNNRQENKKDNAVDNDDDDDDADDADDDEDEVEAAKGSDVRTSPEDDQDNTPFEEDDDDDDFDGDDDEIEAIKVGSQQSAGDNDNDDVDDDDDDDGKADFDVFVDNDGGEEDYLAKLRQEQELRVAAEEARKAAIEPEEETSLTVKVFVGVALLGAAHLLLTSPRVPTKPPAPTSTVDAKGRAVDSETSVQRTVPPSQQQTQPVESPPSTAQSRSILDDFDYAGPAPQQHSSDGNEVIEDNVILFEDDDEGERYSGDEYEYELEELEEEAEEELEEINPEDEEESEQKLIAQEKEIGAFVPITFEDFSSMYRASPEVAEMREQQMQQQQQQQQRQQLESEPQSAVSMKKLQKDSLLARKKPPKGAVNKLIYGLHKDPIVIPDQEEEGLQPGTASAETRENVSAKGENARSVLTALLSEIPSPPPPPPPTELDHQFDKFTSPILPPSSPPTTAPGRQDVMFVQQQPTVAAVQPREKHVEFRLPEPEEPEMLEEIEPFGAIEPTQLDNGSKENLFVPDASEEEFEPEEYGAEYDDEYGIEYEDEEHVYDQDDIDSVLLNQYGSDEEEEPLTDDNIPPGGGEDEESDVDDSDLMRRLEEKYGKLPSPAASSSAAQPVASSSTADQEEADEDDATAAGWTKIPTRAEEADRSYQEELRRAQQQLDEGKAQDALKTFDGVLSRKKPNSIPALVGRARALDALAEQRRSNALLIEAIAVYRKLIVVLELSVDDATLRSIGERCIDRMRFQGQHANAIEVHQTLIRRFNDEPHFRNQLAVTYLYMNRLADAKAVLHETLLRWIEDGFALVHYGFVLKTHDQNMELAAQYLREGIDTGHEGTQDGRFYFHLGDALQRLGRTAEAHDIYRRGVQRKLFLSLYQRSLYNVDGLRSRPFWTEQQTTYAGELESIRSQWTLIRDEGLKLLNSAGVFVNETENLRDRGDWKQLELFARGARVERNCARAPLTCRLVEQHFPAARTCKRGQVKFSVMHPGTHVWPHCGPTNCRIRAHLGLNVPSGTYIRVAEETRSWENGKWLIFDDSFEHEVWHNGTATRLVLIVDFWHPELTESQRRTLSPI